MLRTMLSDMAKLSEEKVDELMDAFINIIPVMLRLSFQSA